jgi:hypothetical protein
MVDEEPAGDRGVVLDQELHFDIEFAQNTASQVRPLSETVNVYGVEGQPKKYKSFALLASSAQYWKPTDASVVTLCTHFVGAGVHIPVVSLRRPRIEPWVAAL